MNKLDRQFSNVFRQVMRDIPEDPRQHFVEVEQTLQGIHTGLDWLVEHAKLGDLSWSDLQEIKDNIKILEAKCNGNR